jgi:hypothetical protein
MKLVILIIQICLVFSINVGAQTPKYKIEPTTLLPFDIFIKDPDPARDQLPVIRFVGTNGYSIYKVEESKDTSCTAAFRLALSQDNKPILTKLGDAKYYDNLYNIVFRTNPKYFVGDSALESITLSLITPTKGKDTPDEENGICLKVYSKELFINKRKRQKEIFLGLIDNKEFPAGSIAYIDSNYQIEWRKNINNKLVVTRRDAILGSTTKDIAFIPGISEAGSDFDGPSDFIAVSHAHLRIDSMLYHFDGDPYDNSSQLQEYQITRKNGIIMIDAFLLREILLCQYESIKVNKTNKFVDTFTFYKLYKDKNTVKTVSVTFNINDNKCIINGVEKNFSIKPYESKSGLCMVPLIEMCDALFAHVYYRHIDDTVVIPRSSIYQSE